MDDRVMEEIEKRERRQASLQCAIRDWLRDNRERLDLPEEFATTRLDDYVSMFMAAAAHGVLGVLIQEKNRLP